MRVAYFGGSFDPPHRGHLAVARAAADTFALDHVLLAPTGVQPLKPAGSQASFAHRLAMTALLCREDGRLEPSALDAPRLDGQPNYTVDTLAALSLTLAPGDTLFVVVGADAFAALPQWRAPDQLLHAAEWIVVSRPGLDTGAVIAQVIASPPAAASSPRRIHCIADVAEPASATQIRRRLAAGQPCNEWLTPPVAQYIAAHKLYTRPEDASLPAPPAPASPASHEKQR